MKVFFTFSLCIVILIPAGCSKKSDSATSDISAPKTPQQMILGKWNVIKDSIVVHNFMFSNGDIPIPGVYIGNANDYWMFNTDSTLNIAEGGPQLNCTYHFISSNSLNIPETQWGNITLLVFTNTVLTWEKSILNPNGGTYYRRAYLSR
ncbi:MAG: hypothetical protein JST86_20450 [Bacteroidetes bacterium]|nr:hypothetical protein [Bacteroidota bacterium]